MAATTGKASVPTMSLLVTGNLLGAGILALPVNLGPAGMIPAAAGIVLVWAIMLASAWILVGQDDLVQGDSGGLPSFFGAKMGPAAKWLAVAADLVVFYGVLTAYLTGTTTILTNLFILPVSKPVATLAYFVIVAGLTGFGMSLLRRCNTVILVSMGLTFSTMVAMTLGHVEPARALPMRWGFLPAAMPVALTAFLFHNLIPTLCREMGDRAAVRRAVLYGSLIGLAMNLAWTGAVFCSLPMQGPESISLLWAYKANLPATVPLSLLLDSKLFTNIGLIFAILSMSAAFLANGTALQDFLLDLTSTYLRTRSKILIWALAFLPPLLVSIFYPGIFLTAMNLVGGVGICLLFGVLPGFLLLRQATGPKRILAVALLVLFGAVLVFELGQELGLTNIHPDVEYWTQFVN